jgi:MFS family permease
MSSSHKSPKVFYGWWVVGACFVVAFYMGGIIFYGFTALFEPFVEEFGWSYAQVSFAASLRGLEAGLLTPFIGILVDRWGPRKVIFAGVIFTVLGLMLLSQTESLGMFYGAFVLIAIGTSCASSTVTLTAAANWFRKKVAIATGIVSSGYACSGLLVPLMVKLIALYGWREMLIFFSLGLLVVGPLSALVIRHKPEHYGYLPDGEVTSQAELAASPNLIQDNEAQVSVRQALQNRAFWLIALGILPQFISVVTVVTHIMPYLSSIGMARSLSSLAAMAIPLFSMGGRLGFGWLGDRTNKKRLIMMALTMMASGLICLELVALVGLGWLAPFFILFCIGYGGILTVTAALARDYFGRGRFGTLIGLIWGLGNFGALVGPPIAGWVFDNWGSYQWVWLGFAALNMMGVIIMFFLPPANVSQNKA